MKNFPARHLAKKPSNSNLNALRKTLFDAGLETELIKVLKKKVFPTSVLYEGENYSKSISGRVRFAGRNSSYSPISVESQWH